MQCNGTWEPSRVGLYCSVCDTEYSFDEGPPYAHGKPRADYQYHGLTRTTKRLVFAALFKRQQGKCFICGVSQASLEEEARVGARGWAERRKKELAKDAPRAEGLATFLSEHPDYAQRYEAREQRDRAISQDELVAVYYRRSAVLHTLHIDHCHITGAIRGLLCSQCNYSIGNVENWGILSGNIRPDLSERDIELCREWVEQHKDAFHLYMQRERWLPRKDILFHLQRP